MDWKRNRAIPRYGQNGIERAQRWCGGAGGGAAPRLLLLAHDGRHLRPHVTHRHRRHRQRGAELLRRREPGHRPAHRRRGLVLSPLRRRLHWQHLDLQIEQEQTGNNSVRSDKDQAIGRPRSRRSASSAWPSRSTSAVGATHVTLA
jgi:hypothetical protein